MLITHRTNVIGVTTELLLLRDGVLQMYGPSAEVLAEISKLNKDYVQAANKKNKHTETSTSNQDDNDAPGNYVAIVA